MNILDEAAALIDPDAFAPGDRIDLPAALRKKTAQGNTRVIASRVLKLAQSRPNLRAELIEAELNLWEALGVLAAMLEKEDFRAAIESKYPEVP